MALSLNLSVIERNDNTALVIRDNTGITTTTSWYVNGNVDYTDINTTYAGGTASGYSGSGIGLILNISITTSDNVETVYDTIDLYDEFGSFVYYDDLLYTITAPHLKIDGVSPFATGDELPDGTYELSYQILTYPSTNINTFTQTYMIYGQVRTAVYDLLRQIPTSYENSLDMDDYKTREAMFAKTYLSVLEADPYSAKREEDLNILYTLERIVANGSSNSW
jgi:hypothetical protein